MPLKFYKIGEEVAREDMGDVNLPATEQPPLLGGLPVVTDFGLEFSPVIYDPQDFSPQRKIFLNFTLKNPVMAEVYSDNPGDAAAQLKETILDGLATKIDAMILHYPDFARVEVDEHTQLQLEKVVVARIADEDAETLNQVHEAEQPHPQYQLYDNPAWLIRN